MNKYIIGNHATRLSSEAWKKNSAEAYRGSNVSEAFHISKNQVRPKEYSKKKE